MSALARVCTASTAASPTTPATSATAAAGDRRAVPLRPPPRPPRQRLAPGRHRLVGHPPLDVVGQRPAARRSGPRASVAIALRQTASSARSIDGSSCRGGGNSPRWTLRSTSPTSPSNGGLAGQQAVERGAEAVDVGARARAGRGRRRPARGSCRPACPAPMPGSVSALPLAERGHRASARRRRAPARPARAAWPGPSRRPASRRACRR